MLCSPAPRVLCCCSQDKKTWHFSVVTRRGEKSGRVSARGERVYIAAGGNSRWRSRDCNGMKTRIRGRSKPGMPNAFLLSFFHFFRSLTLSYFLTFLTTFLILSYFSYISCLSSYYFFLLLYYLWPVTWKLIWHTRRLVIHECFSFFFLVVKRSYDLLSRLLHTLTYFSAP